MESGKKLGKARKLERSVLTATVAKSSKCQGDRGVATENRRVNVVRAVTMRTSLSPPPSLTIQADRHLTASP